MKSAFPKTMDSRRKCSVNNNLRYIFMREKKSDKSISPDAV